MPTYILPFQIPIFLTKTPHTFRPDNIGIAPSMAIRYLHHGRLLFPDKESNRLFHLLQASLHRISTATNQK